VADGSGRSHDRQSNAAPVLLTDARWRKALSAARALGRRGVPVITTDATRLVPAAVSRYVRRHVVLPAPATDPAGFVEALRSLAASHPGLVVFPLEDETVAVVAAGRERLAGLRLAIPPTAAVEVALDKARTAERAAALGIPVPRWVAPRDAGDLAAARALAHPVVVKPRRGFGAQGVTEVADPAALEAVWRRVDATFPRPLVQERVPAEGDAHGVSCIFNAAGAPRATFVHRRLREYPLRGGPSTLRESVERPDLVEASVRLLGALGWVGFAMVEWKTDPRDGRARVLEINPRFVGSLELAVQSGVDFPWLLYQVATTGDCDAIDRYRTGQLCRWLLPGDLLHFLANPDRRRLRPSFFRFRAPNLTYDDWAADDPLPSLAQLGVLAVQALRPAMWRYVRTRATRLPG
jgi:predicted ATP-grasp superfamily ATP-dependent carboligase